MLLCRKKTQNVILLNDIKEVKELYHEGNFNSMQTDTPGAYLYIPAKFLTTGHLRLCNTWTD